MDIQLLGIPDLPVAARFGFLGRKACALVTLAIVGRASLRLPHNHRFRISSISDLGTLQSTLIDASRELGPDRILDGAKFVVDVGANVGQWSSVVKILAPWVEVLALEPDPVIFRTLEQNMADLPNVTCECAAAASTAGAGFLYRHELSIMSSIIPNPGNSERQMVPIRLVALDDLIDRPVDVLKIDVEGAELDVLRGARGTLQQTRYLVIELSFDRSTGSSALNTLGFIWHHFPNARLLGFGRPLCGPGARLMAQDAIIALHTP